MSTLVTKPAPDFKAQAVMPDNSFAEISLAPFRGKYLLLFFYPLDFTFVCPTEILALDQNLERFKERNCEVLAVSVDSQYTHFAWRNTPVREGGIGQVGFPIIADLDKKIAAEYGVLLPAGISLRALFLIDRDAIVRHAVINDLPLGRNVEEALRMVDALQFHERHGEVCPANWRPGEEAMQPTPAGVAEYLARRTE